MTNSGWACKKEGVATPRRADTRCECIRPMYYSTVAFFSSAKKVMPIVKLTDWGTRRAKREPRIRR